VTPFLDSFGAEKAERCLAEFVACVRGLDADGQRPRSRAVLDDELAALLRRADAAEVELAQQRSELARQGDRLCTAIGAAHGAVALDGAGDLSHLIADLHSAIPAHEAERRALERAELWLADLAQAATALAARLGDEAGPEATQETSRALVRAISQVSVALDAMTEAARRDRERRDALRAASGEVRLEAVLRNPLIAGRSGAQGQRATDPAELFSALLKDLGQSTAQAAPAPGPNKKLH